MSEVKRQLSENAIAPEVNVIALASEGEVRVLINS